MSGEVERPHGCSMVVLLTLCSNSFVGSCSVWSVQKGRWWKPRREEAWVWSQLIPACLQPVSALEAQCPGRPLSSRQPRTVGHSAWRHRGAWWRETPQWLCHPTSSSYISGSWDTVGPLRSAAWDSGPLKGWLDVLSCPVHKITSSS